jgi:hypothetical protein
MCPTWGDNNGDIKAPPYAVQFENLYNLVNQLLLKVDVDPTKPPTPNKQHNIPSFPACVVSEKERERVHHSCICEFYQDRVHRPA